MLNSHVNDTPSIYPVGPDGKIRFQRATNFVMKNGSFPKPIIAMQLKDGLSILDGNHRMSALCLCQLKPDKILSLGGVGPAKSHKLWIGSHAAGEVPVD
jgi:hypothetical protein